jgi:branched-chain amino acid transport system substrate-binding protein
MKRLSLLLALVLLSALAAVSAAGAAPLKIGVLTPLTGSESADGNDILNGVKTAVEVVKAEGGVPGFDGIEIVAQDDACDPKQAVSGANKLINEKVAGVVGSYCSSATLPSSETLDQESIPMITPASTNPKVTERGLRYMFRMCGRDDDQGPAGVKFMVDQLKAKKLYIIDDKTAYSQGLADKVEETAKAMGLTVAGHEHVNKDDKDYSAVLTKVKQAAPDVLYMSLQNNAAGSTMALQAKRLDIKAKIVAQDAVYHPNFISVGKDAVQGVFLTFGYIDESTPSYKKFLAAYTKISEKPGAYSAYAYDSAYALLSGIKAAKSVDPEKIKAEMLKLNYDGASKHIKFKPNGDSGSDYIIYMVKGDQFVKYYNPTTGKLY